MTAERIDNGIVTLAGIRTEVWTRGDGQPLLFLHPHIGIDPNGPFISQLARDFRVIVPSHPGFGRSEVADFMTTVDDLAYFYLDFLETLALENVVLTGASFGGWIAAEIAIKSTRRISHLIMADAVGVKLSAPETPDVVDIFTITQDAFNRLAYHRVNPRPLDAKTMSEDEVLSFYRNREATARFAWKPYMYDPKLIHRLHRIDVPTLMLWGAHDGVASVGYGRRYAQLMAKASFEIIEDAGHFPHLDQPETFVKKLTSFVRTAQKAAA